MRGSTASFAVLSVSIAAVAVLGITSSVRAEVTFDLLGVAYATGISADGTVVVGNTVGNYETFRWTEDDGIVPLGRATVPVIGVGAGAPDVSADGTRISATILTDDNTMATQGVWTLGAGWQECMPPTPVDGGSIDNSLGSAWGLSDDGTALVGFYWRPGQAATGLAHASIWRESEGVTDLGTTGRNARANDTNADGSVTVGWNEAPDGVWQSSVWANGEITVLSPPTYFCEASVVNPAGTIIAGQVPNAGGTLALAALWRWDGDTWVEQVLGVLPNTFRLAAPNDMTPDGSIVVGYDEFQNPSSATGFMWTQETGMIDVEDYLEDNGVVIPTTFNILSLTGISDDGTVMVGIGQDRIPPFTPRSFIIRSTDPAGIGQENTQLVLALAASPNPTTGPVSFRLALPVANFVGIDIHDASGRLVRHLGSGHPTADLELVWDGKDGNGRDVSGGLFYYRAQAGSAIGSGKIVRVR